ncbi:MAG: undecaprenyldiphospho-muramoylpentapeptide beta-N-acetylglucosaminyltransferase [Deltaproteobacteria bacterium]|nr:undecaprenyldiphospho-muramoylpentapeptide beta-N-acetylglucosaminyltransferase [Deltaproteobacteria bacterium]
MKRRRATPLVALAGGGTGGHVVPALALADAFAAAGTDVLFIGTEHGYEATMVPKRGYRIELVPGSRLVGGSLATKLRGLVHLVRGLLAARRLLRREAPDLVLGVGGYASGAALLAAKTLGIPSGVHESNAVPGLTNKVLGRLVDRVYLGFSAALHAFPAQKSRISGNPVRAEIAAVGERRMPRERAQAHILVIGGSQGSQFLNERVPALLLGLAAAGVPIAVRHQVGKLNPAPVQATYTLGEVQARVEGFIDDMAAAYAWADVAITRSGSGTVAELAAAALPALLVPFPHAAGDHQAANATAFCAEGAGRWVRQDAWNQADLSSWLGRLLTDADRWSAASDAARNFALPQAARAVVADCGQWLGIAQWAQGAP